MEEKKEERIRERKTPYTKGEFFEAVMKVIRDKDLCPDILDYDLPTSEKGLLEDDEFEIDSKLNYGASEGIYIDLSIKRYDEKNKKMVLEELGTIKTLKDNDDAMRAMGSLLGTFLAEANRFLREHSEDFCWEGYWVGPVKGEKDAQWYYTCGTEERRDEKIKELMEKPDVTEIKIVDMREGTVERRKV